MQKNSLFVLALLIIFIPGAFFAQGTPIILDTFDDDTLGQPPGVPEVGTSFYFGTATQTIIDTYGSKSLRSNDSSTSDGWAIQWFSTENPPIFEASYEYRIESSTSTSNGVVEQSAVVSTPTSTELIALEWIPNAVLKFHNTATTFSWAYNTTYLIQIAVNCDTNTTSLRIDGNDVLTDLALGFSCTAFHSFTDGSFTLYEASRSIDEVKIVASDSIFADGFESGDTSKWSASEPPNSPSGDTCGEAIPYTGGTLIGDLSDNTASGVSDSCGTGNTIDEWVSYTATCDGTLTVDTCYPSTAVDTIVSAFSIDATCSGGEVACNDDATGAPPECDLGGLNRKSQAIFAVTAGLTYVFRVSTYNDGVGAYEIGAVCIFSP